MNFFDLFTDNKKGQEKNQNPQINNIQAEPENLEAGKEHIYNLIIVDESGSMSGLDSATIAGVNETINTVREAQTKFGDKQQHFLTLVTFDSRKSDYPSVRTLINRQAIDKVSDFSDYHPHGCTPLYDAIGISVTELSNHISADPDATGIVTILTDGMENDSRHYNFQQIRMLIENLKEKGWTFSYVGSAHDVEAVARDLSIDNVMEFSHDTVGTGNSWHRERASRMNLFSKMSLDWDDVCEASVDVKISRKKAMASEYYKGRVTPDHVTTLADNEIIVLGSSSESGLSGNCYYILSTAGPDRLAIEIKRFIDLAIINPDKKFLVTRVGCGHAGYSPARVAPKFSPCITMENVALPKEFWAELGIKTF